MSATAVVSVAGVGAASSAEYTIPVTSGEVANTPDAVGTSANPVNPDDAIGVRPTLPNTAPAATIEIPDVARIAKLAAVRRLTVAGPAGVGSVLKLHAWLERSPS
jgi:hypothetical protein